MLNATNSPLLRAVLQILLIIGVIALLFYGKALLLPLLVAGILALVLDPLVEKLINLGLPEGLAITGAVLVLVAFFAGLFLAVGQQVNTFIENWPVVKQSISDALNAFREKFGLGALIPKLPSSEGEGGMLKNLPFTGYDVMGVGSSFVGVLTDFLLTFVYLILFLSQKHRLREFVLRLMADEQRGLTHRTMNEGREVVQSYLRGRLILMAILTVLYVIGFLIIGLEYAFMIAVLVAIMSIIPYLGNIIGGLIAIALAFAGGGGSSAIIGVLLTIGLAQTLESYVLTPLIVGDEVDLNPLATIICVLGLTLLWGPVGAIIAIPLTGIARVVFSHVKGLKDYAFLLGQEEF